MKLSKVNLLRTIYRNPKLVFACAWCPKSKHSPLKKGEEYTHGICTSHLTRLTKEWRQRKLQVLHH